MEGKYELESLFSLFFQLSWILATILEFFFETELFLRYYLGLPVQKSSLTNRFCASAETALVRGRFDQLRSTECVHAELSFTVWVGLRHIFCVIRVCKCYLRICPVREGYPWRLVNREGLAISLIFVSSLWRALGCCAKASC